MKLEKAIQQKSFKSQRQKAHINLVFTASFLNLDSGKVLKPFGISIQQFNILRILKGAHPKPSSIKELTTKMLDRSSNASRLVDKLLEKELVERRTCPVDRRQVEIYISEKGKKLIAKASEAIQNRTQTIFQNISEEELVFFNNILDKLRE